MKKLRASWPFRIAVTLLMLTATLFLASRLVGANRRFETPLPEGSLAVPHERITPTLASSALKEGLIKKWSEKALPDWKSEGKIVAPRVALAKLVQNRDVPEVNAYLAAQVPWGRTGSTWPLNPNGDYDFTLVPLTILLYQFGDRPETLYPATREHLLSVLLTEEGGDPKTASPWSLWLVRETENHILMDEGSRYLKNRWLHLHGNPDARYDNEKTGLEDWMVKHLRGLNAASLHEFNSMPYSGYTLTALLTLEAFASDAVRSEARNLLDRLSWNYALGSLDYRRYPPLRRKTEEAKKTALGKDYQTALAKVWMSLRPDITSASAAGKSNHHALLAALLPYRLPDETARWIAAKSAPYFVQIGHGPDASPEIYTGGPGYLLSAGGVHGSLLSQIVARPITLLLDDSAQDLKEVLHLAGPGQSYWQWNNTGVLGDLAVAAGPVSVPSSWSPRCQGDGWSIYVPEAAKASPSLVVAVYTSPSFGLVALLHGVEPQQGLDALRAANPDTTKIQAAFQWPAGSRIEYDVNAPRSLGVMTRKDGQPLAREHGKWPLLEGTIASSTPSSSN